MEFSFYTKWRKSALERIEVSGMMNDEDDVLRNQSCQRSNYHIAKNLSTVVVYSIYQYDSDGYLIPNVPKTHCVTDTTGRVALKIEITEGPKVKVDYIHFPWQQTICTRCLKSGWRDEASDLGGNFGRTNSLIRQNTKKTKISSSHSIVKTDFAMLKFLSDSLSYEKKTKKYLTITLSLRRQQFFVRNIAGKEITVYPADVLKCAPRI